MPALKISALPKPLLASARLKGLGVLVGIAIAAAAIFALTHALKKINTDEVLAVVQRTDARDHRAGACPGRALLWQPDPVRSVRAAHHRARRRAVPDRGAGEFHQLSDRARHRRGGADLAGDPLPDLFMQRARHAGCRQHLLPDRADLLARQSHRVRSQCADPSRRHRRDRPSAVRAQSMARGRAAARRGRFRGLELASRRGISARCAGRCGCPKARWCWCRY